MGLEQTSRNFVALERKVRQLEKENKVMQANFIANQDELVKDNERLKNDFEAMRANSAEHCKAADELTEKVSDLQCQLDKYRHTRPMSRDEVIYHTIKILDVLGSNDGVEALIHINNGFNKTLVENQRIASDNVDTFVKLQARLKANI